MHLPEGLARTIDAVSRLIEGEGEKEGEKEGEEEIFHQFIQPALAYEDVFWLK